MTQHETREGWLRAAVEAVRPIVGAPAIHVSMGRCTGRGRASGKAIGECWDGRLSSDGAAHIFISPELTEKDPARVLDVLIHEIIHAKVGLAEGHRGAFAKLAESVGLVRPWTATTAGDDLRTTLVGIAEALGPFPHAALRDPVTGSMPRSRMPRDPGMEPKFGPGSGSRLRLWECSCPKPVKVRVCSDDFKATCDLCSSAFVLKAKVPHE